MRTAVMLFLFAGLWVTQAMADDTSLDSGDIAKILIDAGTLQAKPVPKGLLSKKGPFDKGEYDPNQLLARFSRLKIEPGRVLDFVYDLQDLGGHPVVYARASDRAPFANLADFKKEHPRRYFLGDKVRFDPACLGSIQTDGTPDGYLQLAMFVLIGEQFYIHWHAAYSLMEPVMDKKTLDEIVVGLPDALKKPASAIDFAPRVSVGTDTVTVQYVVFNAWQGFKRIDWTVSRSVPHRLIRSDERLLVRYDNPMRF